MDLSITTDEADRLECVRGDQQATVQHKLAALSAAYASAQVDDPRTPEEIIGYDSAGAPD